MPRSRLELPDTVLETMHVCALRFDGYRWLETMRSDGEIDFAPWTVPVVGSLVFHEDDSANFATFFALQRWLFKWGEETLPPSAPEHTAFRFLFLHLHPLPTPSEFAHEEYAMRWRRLSPATIQKHAGTVRRALLPARLAREIEGVGAPPLKPHST